MSFSNDNSLKVLRALINEASYINPTEFHVQLHIGNPTNVAATAESTKTTQTAGRTQMTGAPPWAAATNAGGAGSASLTSNTQNIDFVMTGATPGTVDFCSVWNSSAGTADANYLSHGAVTPNVTFEDTDVLQFAPTKLTWTLQ